MGALTLGLCWIISIQCFTQNVQICEENGPAHMLVWELFLARDKEREGFRVLWSRVCASRVFSSVIGRCSGDPCVYCDWRWRINHARRAHDTPALVGRHIV